MSKLNLISLAEKIEKDDNNKKDLVLPVNRLIMGSTGEVGFKMPNGGGNSLVQINGFDRLSFNDYALSQMFSKLGIDVKFGKKVMEESPKLIAPIFNHWANKASQSMLIRIRDAKDGTGIIRGVLSNSYTKLDNNRVMDSLLELSKGMPEHEVISYHLDDRRFHVRLSFPDLSVNVGQDVRGVGDIVQVGTDIVNSEVGNSSLNVSGLVYRLVCTNGMKRVSKDGEDFSQRHIHLKSSELYGRMNQAICDSIKAGDKMIDEIKRGREITVENPMTVIEQLSKQEKYSQDFTDKLKTAYSIEPDKNVWGIINAFTRASHALPNERRLEVERTAGELLFDRNRILKIDFGGDR